jgi:CHAT domain-containing protein
MKRRSLRFIQLFLLGLFFSFSIFCLNISPILAQASPLEQEVAGQSFYQNSQFEQAIEQWQNALQAYENDQNLLAQARVSSNLALAYQQRGLWQQADEAIEQSLELLKQTQSQLESQAVLAQTFNNRGLIELARGRRKDALATWQLAEPIYQNIGDKRGIFNNQINQAMVLKRLGLYPNSCRIILESLGLDNLTCRNIDTEAQESLLKQYLKTLDSSLESNQFTAWRILGEVYRLLGNNNQAELIFNHLLMRVNSQEQQGLLYLNLGRLATENRLEEKALDWYQKTLETSDKDSLRIRSYLAQLQIYIDRQEITNAIDLIPKISSTLESLPDNGDKISATINFTASLMRLKRLSDDPKIPSWLDIASLLSEAKELATNLGSQTLQSQTLGNLGAVYEQNQQDDLARTFTESALLIAQANQTPEITYRWQWQLGRILADQGQIEQAIASYSEAIKTLRSIEQDLVASDRDVRSSFQEEIEPVYRQLVSLLLKKDEQGKINLDNIIKARDTIESLRLAELNNFFREACLEAKPQSLEAIDSHAAIIYPIILDDRLAIILSLPNQPLQYYSTAVTAKTLTETIKNFRFNVVVRPRRDFFAPAQQLYQWLIEPIAAQLTENKIKTLVFVLDGALRNIPMSALYDGQNYLIEKYEIALAPSLQLLEPQELQRSGVSILALGLSKAREGFLPLYYVNDELKSIGKNLNSDILLNESFTIKALEQGILNFPSSIVHIATHGQFSSNFEDTFILAWDGRINVDKLDQILRSREQIGAKAIELIVLSACETAAGDNRAALGLAGLAVRSGARSTLATLWTVNDEATAEFMNQFYQGLGQQKLSKSAALRQAQLSLLKDKKFRHPFYWSPYVLLGNWL